MSISLPVAFLAGLASFLSPCVLPLVPVYLAVIGGASPSEVSLPGQRGRLVIRAALFVAGFSMVFIALGMSASLVGTLLLTYRRVLKVAAGALAVFFGLYFAGFINIPALARQRKFEYTPKAPGLWQSFVLGMAFSVGWTPCVAPALGTILGLAGSTGTALAGFFLLAAYSVGLGLPFVAAAIFIRYLLPKWSRVARYARVAQIAGGLLLSVMGLMLMTGLLDRFAAILGG